MTKAVGIIFLFALLTGVSTTRANADEELIDRIAYAVSHGIKLTRTDELANFLFQLPDTLISNRLEKAIAAECKKSDLGFAAINHGTDLIEYVLRKDLFGITYQLFLDPRPYISNVYYYQSGLPTGDNWLIPDWGADVLNNWDANTLYSRDRVHAFMEVSTFLIWLIKYDISIPGRLSERVSLDIQHDEYLFKLKEALERAELNVYDSEEEFTVWNGKRNYLLVQNRSAKFTFEVTPAWN